MRKFSWSAIIGSLILTLFFLFLDVLLTTLVYLAGLSKALIHLSRLSMDSLCCAILIACFGLIYWRVYQRPKNQLARRARLNFFQLVVIALGMLGITAAWYLLIDHIFHDSAVLDQPLEVMEEVFGAFESESLPIYILSVAILGPIYEEILFRGVIQECLTQGMGPIWGIVLSALLFGFWHMILVQSVYTFMAGLILGCLKEKSGSLKYPIIVHMVNNGISALPEGSPVFLNLYWVDLLSLLMVIPALYFLLNYLLTDRAEAI